MNTLDSEQYQEELNRLLAELGKNYKWLLTLLFKYIDSKEKRSKRAKEYYIKNKQKLDEYHKQYRIKHPEYRERAKERSKKHKK